MSSLILCLILQITEHKNTIIKTPFKNIFYFYYIMEIRKFNTEFRKQLRMKINKLENVDHYRNIYSFIKMKVHVSINKNGAYFDLNKIDNDTIEEINNYIDEYL